MGWINIEFKKEYKLFPNLTSFYIGYICKDENCSLPNAASQKESNLYFLFLNYSGYKINHQNEISPLEKTRIIVPYILCPFKNKYTFYYNHWKIIKYKEEKGLIGTFESLSGNNNEYYGVEFINSFIYTPEKSVFIKYLEEVGNFKILAFINTPVLDVENYIDIYSRTKKSIWTSFANICSLSVSIYSGFIFIFCKFYSNNFDNYKIIEKILSKNHNIYNNKIITKTKINSNDKMIIELSNDFDIKDNLINNNSNNNDISDEVATFENKDNNIIENNNNNDIIENRYLPKLHFYDFFFNNIYIKKCCASNTQEIISTCNGIITKFYSIDNIIFNLIKLENLFKDYKWNNPNLNNVQNNESIMELNSFI